MASYVPGAPDSQRKPGILQAIARAYFARERQRLGIGAEERADAESSMGNILRQAQLARLVQQMGFAPAQHKAELELRGAQTEQATAHAEAYRTPRPEKQPAVGSFEDYVVQQFGPRPSPEQIAQARKAYQQADDRPREPRPEPGRLTPLVDANGKVIGTFHNVTGAVGPVQGTPAGPGQPATVGDVEVRKTPMPAQERKDKAGLEQALEGAQSLRRILTLPDVQDAIGFASGRIADVKRRTIGASPEVQELFRTSDRMAEFLLRALSGAQINESEYGRLRALIPDPRSHISKFTADLNLFERELKSTIGKRFPGAQLSPDSGGGNTRVINGITYTKVPGGWQRQQ